VSTILQNLDSENTACGGVADKLYGRTTVPDIDTVVASKLRVPAVKTLAAVY
jgi:hypothetical protein